MKETHIILRSPRSATRDVFLGAGPLGATFAAAHAAEAVAAGLTVDLENIDRSDVPRLTNQAGVVAVAPSIPIKLVKPTEVDTTAQPAAAGSAWGVRAVGADTSPSTGNGIVVAVLDTGIDATHSAFAGVNLVEKDFTGEGNGDQHGHGTHCAGTIFGRDTNGVRIGVARGVQKALIGKVLGAQGGASDTIVSAILWAVENGANVISMSLGIDFPGLVADLEQRGFPTELATSRALEGYRANVQLFERLASLVHGLGAFSQATVIVAAAGNESRKDLNPDFKIAVSPPAVSEGIVSVAALGEGGPGQGLLVAPFSNTGANVSGPGVKIVSAKRGGGLVLMSGTSMATPHVAGVAALWAEKLGVGGPLNSFQLGTRLAGSATTAGLQAGFDPVDVGLGLIQAPQA
jgi:subtilisin family serine protease